VQKVLEDANIKLASILSDLFGASGQEMLELFSLATQIRNRSPALHAAGSSGAFPPLRLPSNNIGFAIIIAFYCVNLLPTSAFSKSKFLHWTGNWCSCSSLIKRASIYFKQSQEFGATTQLP